MTDLQALRREFEQRLVQVTQEREKLEETESALLQAVESLLRVERLNGSPAPAPEPDDSLIQSDQFLGMSIKGATVEYLRLVGAPQTNRQIVDALLRGGITSQSANFAKTVRAVLLHDLEKAEPLLTWNAPLWSLREWVLPLGG